MAKKKEKKEEKFTPEEKLKASGKKMTAAMKAAEDAGPTNPGIDPTDPADQVMKPDEDLDPKTVEKPNSEGDATKAGEVAPDAEPAAETEMDVLYEVKALLQTLCDAVISAPAPEPAAKADDEDDDDYGEVTKAVGGLGDNIMALTDHMIGTTGDIAKALTSLTNRVKYLEKSGAGRVSENTAMKAFVGETEGLMAKADNALEAKRISFSERQTIRNFVQFPGKFTLDPNLVARINQ